VVCGDINPVPDDLNAEKNIVFQKVDVTSWAELSSLFKKAKSTFGQIDHVFANAGKARFAVQETVLKRSLAVIEGERCRTLVHRTREEK
jgi:NAD(P)-dependent dehydrogenase (short-subunit alcohol dehydrogenase family)